MIKNLILLSLISTNCLASSFISSSWECIGRVIICHTWRMSVPTGWIVSSDNSVGGGEHGYAMTFVPDPDHKWKI